jgi:two-component system chemotaxis sensor kinase CheA
MSESVKNRGSDLGSKYRSLIIFITVFVLIVVGILVLNVRVSQQFGSDAVGINIAGRQRMLSQRLPKTINELLLKQQNGEAVDAVYQELQTTHGLFDETLNAFTSGGEITDAAGNRIQLDPAEIAAAREALTAANSRWQAYNQAITELLSYDVAAFQSLSDLVAAFKQNNEPLLGLMNQLTNAYEQAGVDQNLINVAGRQRMLSQKMTKQLQDFVDAQAGEVPIEQALDNFIETRDLFGQTLLAFTQGAQTQDTFGQMVSFEPVNDPVVERVLADSLDLWNNLDQQINAFVETGAESAIALRSAKLQASQNNVNLLGLMNDLTVSLQNDSEQRSEFLRVLQLAGIVLALVMFGFIVFYFLKKLTATEAQLVSAKNETDRILETVKDGLFLMKPDFTIGNQYSDSLTKIINVDKPEGHNFLSILKKIVPEKTLATAQDYMDLLLGDRVKEELVKDLNPLDEVEVYFDDDDYARRVGHLGFEFNRVTEGDQISHLLVQVNDITDKILLEKQLQESKEKSQEQLDLMLQVLHVDPRQLSQYLSDTERSLLDINQVLQKRTMLESGNREKLDEIFRLMHRIKGDAAALSLDAFETRAHDFENKLEELRNKRNIEGNDFLPLAINLDEFLGQIESLRALIKKLSELQHSVNSGQAAELHLVEDSGLGEQAPTASAYQIEHRLDSLVTKISEDLDKTVNFSMDGEEHIPSHMAKDILDILTQLVRNSVAHGIEATQKRIEHGKDQSGNIQVHVHPHADGLQITVEDDGAGLNTAKIKQTAIRKGLLGALEAEKLNRNQIIGLIFKPGFSTADHTSNHAGRGVGMDIVAKQVKEMQGKMGIKTKAGEGSRFIMRIPVASNEDQFEVVV